MTAILIGVVVLAIAIVAISFIEVEKAQFRRNAELAHYLPTIKPESKDVVIYFSRSGNTELMAMEIAKHYQASLVHLEAEDYRVGFRGFMNALKDFRTQHALITPETVDLSQYDTIFIGSPIWWYSPAPAVWQFIENNDFTGKNVILFTTSNSGFKQEHIDEFKAKVEAKKGRFIKHMSVKRGKMMQQISHETLLEEMRKELNTL